MDVLGPRPGPEALWTHQRVQQYRALRIHDANGHYFGLGLKAGGLQVQVDARGQVHGGSVRLRLSA